MEPGLLKGPELTTYAPWTLLPGRPRAPELMARASHAATVADPICMWQPAKAVSSWDAAQPAACWHFMASLPSLLYVLDRDLRLRLRCG